MPASIQRKKQASDTEIDEVVNAVKIKFVQIQYAAEKRYGIPRSTIRCRLKGISVPRRKAQQHEPLLSSNKEVALFRRCRELTRAGFSLKPSAVREIAAEIQQDCVALITTGNDEPISYPPTGLH